MPAFFLDEENPDLVEGLISQLNFVSEEFTPDMLVSSDARSAEIGSAKMPAEPISAQIRSSGESSRPDGAASVASRLFQIYDDAA